MLDQPISSASYLVVVLGELEHVLDGVLVDAAVLAVVGQRQAVDPRLLVKVQQHLLLKLVLAVVDR